MLASSAVVDRLFYQCWTFPPFRFLYFNLAQSLAIFYGKNDWHYYLSQGFPLLLTTALPFAAVGLWRAARQPLPTSATKAADERLDSIKRQIALTVCVVMLALSSISHKEVRFIYPLLPSLHVLAAESLVDFFPPLGSQSSLHGVRLLLEPWKRAVLVSILAANLMIAYYASVVHQSGVISVLDYIRHRHETTTTTTSDKRITTVGFLMPCHSTPWRSHLVHSGILAWALGCEPPINMALEERASYVDEADRFYLDPVGFIRNETTYSTLPTKRRSPEKGSYSLREAWPECLVFFEQLEPEMPKLVAQIQAHAGGLEEEDGKREYRECWRGFNTHWHDDRRRRGDVIVWCTTCHYDQREQI